DHQAQEIMPPVFNRLVYPGLLAGLEHRSGELLRDPAQPADQKTTTPGVKPSAVQQLQNFTDTLLSLETNIVRFNSLAPMGRGQGEDMIALAKFLAPQIFADLAGRNSAAMDSVVRASFGTPFDGRPWNEIALARLEALVTDVLRQSMNEE